MPGRLAEHRDVELVAVPHTVMATWPVGSFVENIARIGPDEFVVSIHNAAQLHRVTSDGEHHRWVSCQRHPRG